MKKPGDNVESNGGIYQEVGPRGKPFDNFCTVKDHGKLPPTQHAGRKWKLNNRTPDSKRKK